jgi:hypothetical protein
MERNITLVVAARFLLVGTMLSAPVGLAQADELFGFVQITCAPEIGYFAIRRFEISDLPHGGPFLTDGRHAGNAALQALQKKHGIYTSGGLMEHPFECAIPAVKPASGSGSSTLSGFVARVVGHLDQNSQESTYKKIVDDAEVLLDGRSIATLGLNPYGFTVGTSSIEIAQGQPDLVKIECSLPNEILSETKLTCSETFIPPQRP